MSRKDTADDEAPRRHEPKPEADYQCVADHCPARATIFDTVHGAPRGGRCRYHDHAPAQVWTALTALLNRTQSIQETDEGLERLGLTIRVHKPRPEFPRVPFEEARANVQAFIAKVQRGGTAFDSDPDRWWQKINAALRQGMPVTTIQREFAISAWKKAGMPEAHAPTAPIPAETEDELEARIEREAIQSEGA